MDNCQTYGEQFKSALACETKEEAELWMENEVAHCVQHHGKTVTEAMDIIKSNLGYMAGHYDASAAKKVHQLFNAVHPIFGTNDVPAKEALEAGRALGEAQQATKP